MEIHDGSGNMLQQFIRGTQYIDELVMVRVAEKGELYVHQAERDQGGSVKNWNVIGTTDMGRHVVEENVLSPYGQLTVNQQTGFVLDTAWSAEPTAAAQPAAGRRMTSQGDGDQDVDSTDKGTPGSTCTTLTGACRILDLDFDGDYDSTDGGMFDSLESGVAVRPGGSSTNLDQPFAHQS